MEKEIQNIGEVLSRSEQLSIFGGDSSTTNTNHYPPTYPVYPPMPV